MKQAHIRKMISLGELETINYWVIGKNSVNLNTNEGNNSYLHKDIPIKMTGAVLNQLTDFTITLTLQNMDFTELQKSYIPLHRTMDITLMAVFHYHYSLNKLGNHQIGIINGLILNNSKQIKLITHYICMKSLFWVNLLNINTCTSDLNIQLIVFSKFQ
jgi:hypothetical protein